MNTKCLVRKRIWEVDCWSLDAAVAASFEWRDLINILQGNGHQFDLNKSEALLELRAQCMIHEHCHSENPVSLRIENLLNEWNKKTIELFDRWDLSKISEYVLTVSLKDKSLHAGLFWALGSDARESFDCIRRRFHQRFQLFSVRNL